jgi:hypothetical protein
MQYGIDNLLKVVDNIGNIAIAGITIAKTGIGLGLLSKGVSILSQSTSIALSLKECLNEVKDLDAEEKVRLLDAITLKMSEVVQKVVE